MTLLVTIQAEHMPLRCGAVRSVKICQSQHTGAPNQSRISEGGLHKGRKLSAHLLMKGQSGVQYKGKLCEKY